MKERIKRALLALAPQTMTAVMSARARAHSHRYLKQIGVDRVNDKLTARLGSHVQTGPFKGLELTSAVKREQLGPFLLGNYEHELHPWLAALMAEPFSRVVDVGCKFGYYAVGLAKRMPGAEVIAFDTDPWARCATRDLAAANVAANVTVRGYCTPGDLARLAGPRTLVFSDCEGYEAELLLTPPAAAFAGTTLLVELHEVASPGVSARLRERFARSHTFDTVPSSPAPPSAIELAFLDPAERRLAVEEIRGPQAWALFTPHPPPEPGRS